LFNISCKQKFEPRFPVPQNHLNIYNIIQDSLAPLHTELASPQDGEWLVEHPESGQTFKDYVNSKPTIVSEERTKLYVALLSEMDSNQMNIALKTKEYLSVFYSCEVEMISIDVDYTNIAKKYYRYNEKEEIQVLTDFFLKKILVDNLPPDAFAMIGCTTYDIFPDPQWNYVFGQASLNNRVGVWSMRRLGNPTDYPHMMNRTILRNLKIASHETGHMLSMKHCIYYDCIMNGSAHIYETDNKPVYLCPVCLGKVNYNRNFNLSERFENLETFWLQNEISIYHQYYEVVKEIQLQ
jgi:archaemetzincin